MSFLIVSYYMVNSVLLKILAFFCIKLLQHTLCCHHSAAYFDSMLFYCFLLSQCYSPSFTPPSPLGVEWHSDPCWWQDIWIVHWEWALLTPLRKHEALRRTLWRSTGKVHGAADLFWIRPLLFRQMYSLKCLKWLHSVLVQIS